MSDANVIKLRLSLMGRPVRSFTFDKPVINIGRDPESDVFVDNPGVSRDHFRLEKTASGEYQVVDLGSANGTFLNDQMVHTAVVRNNDVVRFGKYTLWVGYEQDRRVVGEQNRAPADTEQHTVVLSRTELGTLLEVSKEKESKPAAAPAVLGPPVVHKAPPAPIAAIVISFLLGAALGAGTVWLLVTRH